MVCSLLGLAFVPKFSLIPPDFAVIMYFTRRVSFALSTVGIYLLDLSMAASKRRRRRSSEQAAANLKTPVYNSNPTKNFNSSNSKFAYLWVIGGLSAGPNRTEYKGYFYSALIAAKLLRDYGSNADFWLFAQPLPTVEKNLTSESTRSTLMPLIPPEIIEITKKAGINLKILPPPKIRGVGPTIRDTKTGKIRPKFNRNLTQEQIQSATIYGEHVFEKFKGLTLTQYSRVLYLDTDITPLKNLDYLFHWSLTGIIRSNFFVSTFGDPMNGGLILMKPEENAYKKMHSLWLSKMLSFASIPRGFHPAPPNYDFRFNPAYEGWGHNFNAKEDDPTDSWSAVSPTFRNQKVWNFHAAFSDQGFWYWYTKYVLKDVSILIGDRMVSYKGRSRLSSVSPILESNRSTVTGELADLIRVTNNSKSKTIPVPVPNDCFFYDGHTEKIFEYLCLPIYRDFVHFVGGKKPWLQQLPHPTSFSTYKYEFRKEGELATYRKNISLYGYDTLIQNLLAGTNSGRRRGHMNFGIDLWFSILDLINNEYNLGLDMRDATYKHDSPWNTKHLPEFSKPSLGYSYKYHQHSLMVEQLAEEHGVEVAEDVKPIWET